MDIICLVIKCHSTRKLNSQGLAKSMMKVTCCFKLPHCQIWHSILNSGNRTEWSSIWSVIIWVIDKTWQLQSRSPICKSWVWLQTELDNTKSYYQLIKTTTTFEKETRHWLHVFIKKKNSWLGGKQDNSACLWCILSTYTGMMCKLSL